MGDGSCRAEVIVSCFSVLQYTARILGSRRLFLNSDDVSVSPLH